MTWMHTLRMLFVREWRIYRQHPLFLSIMLIAPLACAIYFTTLMHDGLPTDLPVGLVDEDDSQVSRTFSRTLSSLQSVELTCRFPSFSAARQAVQRGEIYGFYYIPRDFTDNALASRQPRLSFYTNETFFVPSALIMKDMKQASELANIVMMRTSLRSKGMSESNIMPAIQPIAIDTHPLNNPHINYAVFLCNIFVPGVIILLTMVCAVYTIGMEWKRGMQRRIYRLCNYSTVRFLTGKLSLQMLCFTLAFILIDFYFYSVLGFPCHCGIPSMMMLGWLTVAASQAFAVFAFGLTGGHMRLAMSICALIGVFSFSMSGLTFPVSAMDNPLRCLSWAILLRHYYVLYANLALNGYSWTYAWQHASALFAFMLLPLSVWQRYRVAFLRGRYKE